MARPVDDDANIAAVWDDDRMADIGRLLRGGPALLRGIKKGVKAVARLFLAVLICDFLVGVGGGRLPLLPIGIEAAGRIARDDVLIFAGLDILQATAPM